MLYGPFTYESTVILFLFSFILLARFHGNFGFNKVVSMSHLVFLFMCDLTLKKGRMKSSSYGLPIDMALLLRVWVLARIALHALYTGVASL